MTILGEQLDILRAAFCVFRPFGECLRWELVLPASPHCDHHPVERLNGAFAERLPCIALRRRGIGHALQENATGTRTAHCGVEVLGVDASDGIAFFVKEKVFADFGLIARLDKHLLGILLQARYKKLSAALAPPCRLLIQPFGACEVNEVDAIGDDQNVSRGLLP